MATSANSSSDDPRSMTDEQIVAIIEERERKADNANLAEARAEALDYYMGEPFGNEVEDRSQIVCRDVFEVIEWIKPSLMRIFCGGDEVVKFEPMGPEDVAAAQQETAYINYLMLERGDAFTTLYEWFTDAMLGRNGYLLSTWDTTSQVSEEQYQGLTDDELQLLNQAEGVEILEHQLSQAPGADGQLETFHDVRIRVTEKDGQVDSICLPPERVLVDAHHSKVSLANADFVEYWEEKTISALRQMGLEVADDIASDARTATGAEVVQTSRFRHDPARLDDNRDGAGAADPSSRIVKVRTVFLRIDADGDGIAELRRFIVVGTTILHEDVYSRVTIAALTPVIVPHRHEGMSVADAVMDLQLIKSTMVRSQIDNLFIANNGRVAVDEDRVNLDDLLTSRPGGIVRVMGDPGGAVLPIQHPVLGNQVLQFVEYLDGTKEERTGVSRLNQGIDANTLNKTAAGQAALQAAANQRIELIARVFAETGVKEHFRNLHMLVLQHRMKPDVVELLGKWTTIDPREWKTRKNLRVSVGLGTGDSAGKVQNLQMIATAQQGVQAIGLATPKNMFKALTDMTKAMGFKNGAEYWNDPQGGEPAPPAQPDPQVMAKQAELQQRQQSDQIRAILDAKRIDTDAAQREQDRQAERERAFLDAQVRMATAALSQDASRGQVKRQAAQQMGITTDDDAQLQQQREERQAIAVLTQQVNGLTEVVARLAELPGKPRRVVHHRDQQGRIVASEAVE